MMPDGAHRYFERMIARQACKGAAPHHENSTRPCPVCGHADTQGMPLIETKQYLSCNGCGACFLEPAQRPSRIDEYRHYLTHRNDPSDPRYRAFLARLSDPLIARLQPSSLGMDYGCGPGPALAAVLEEAGHAVALYDPFFFPDPSPLYHTGYDFITCTETAEHFHAPAEEFARLSGLLRPGGLLAVMTKFMSTDTDFASWHYRKDPTHVVFYRRRTFEAIALREGLVFDSPAPDIAFLRKTGSHEVAEAK